METLVIRSAIVYEEASEEQEDDSINKAEQSKTSTITKEMVTEHTKFIKRLNAIAKWEKVTMVLGMIVNLFSSDRVDLEERDAVASAAKRYAQLLHSYLHSKYSSYEATALHRQLILTLREVRAYGELSSQQMVKVTLTDLEPLMREMFSMK